VNKGYGSVGKFINSEDVYNNTNSLIVTADRSLTSISNKLDSMAIVVNSLLTGVKSTLDNVDHVIKNVDNVILNVDNVILEVDKIVRDVRSGNGIVGELLTTGSTLDTSLHSFLDNMILITETTKSSAVKLEENMEALKRNWLFKSYFDQRGVYDRTTYEKQMDSYIIQINDRLRTLDERIERLQNLKKKEKQ
jgi:phospholipid/cholesterol/gamma-HCH transport system substrate-binding protein